MTRLVQCEYLKKEAEGIAFQLYPGDIGQRIFNNISQEAWTLWQSKQTMLINEHKLNLMDPSARQFLETQMVAFLFEGKEVQLDGYVPPTE